MRVGYLAGVAACAVLSLAQGTLAQSTVVPTPGKSGSGEVAGDDQEAEILEALASVVDDMDSNHDGVVDLDESAHFFDELDADEPDEDKHTEFISRRSKMFHRNDHDDDHDVSITAIELLESWRHNFAAQWSPSQVQAWVVGKVELPHLVTKFLNVRGRDLPFMLAKSMHNADYLQREYGIHDKTDRIKLVTELSLLVLQPDDEVASWPLYLALGVTLPILMAVAIYVKIFRDQQLQQVRTMQRFVDDQEDTVKHLSERIGKSEQRKEDAVKRMRSLEKYMSSQSLSREVFEVLQQWRDQDDEAATRVLEKSHQECDEAKRKLNKNQSNSLFSARTIKAHMSGKEDVVRNRYRQAAAKYKDDIMEYETLLKKWAQLEEVAGVRFRRGSDGASLIESDGVPQWNQDEHPSLEDLSKSD